MNNRGLPEILEGEKQMGRDGSEGWWQCHPDITELEGLLCMPSEPRLERREKWD